MTNWLIANPIPNKATSCNKDLNGGYGTLDEIGESISSRLLSFAKKKSVKLPVLTLSYLISILKSNGRNINYSESFSECIEFFNKKEFEACIIYGSIVACELENKLINTIKAINKNVFVIVVGAFPSQCPDNFESADLIIMGEPESLFLEWDGNLSSLYSNNKKLVSKPIDNLDKLPFPDISNMNPNKHSYKPMLPSPTGFIEASRGCPYSCGYYCTYGNSQGKSIRSHTAKELVLRMVELKSKYGFKSFQFRDPVFGLKKGFIENFCTEIIKSGNNLTWGMETRSDLLNQENIRLMASAGLRSINIGIETPNTNIASSSKRITDELDHQKLVTSFSKKMGIKINAFYILGLEEDTFETCLDTIKYSLSLDTFMARYSVCTPYPGTMYYKDLSDKKRIKDFDLSHYNQQSLIYEHKNLDNKTINQLLDLAYRKYYIRPKKIFNLSKDSLLNYFK